MARCQRRVAWAYRSLRNGAIACGCICASRVITRSASWSSRCRMTPIPRRCFGHDGTRMGIGQRDCGGGYERRDQRDRRHRSGARSVSPSRNEVLNAFTAVTAERARARATAIDAVRAAGKPVGPLAGVPFAVKNLIDIAGLPTVAGSKINRAHPPAAADATLVRRLEAAGAVSGRRAEHGRIRLRLHRREQPRRRVAQSA